MLKTTMTKQRFAQIFRLQKESGLTVEAFLENNGYPHSSYYGWKSKFFPRTSDEDILAYSSNEAVSPVMVPVTLDKSVEAPMPATSNLAPKPPVCGGAAPQPKVAEISIVLPNGMEINFNGARARESAVAIISNLYNANVLPE